MLVDTRPAAGERPGAAEDPTETIDPAVFRKVMGHVPTGVTVVSAMTWQGPVGLTVGSFVSASLDPPLVGFLPARSSTTWPLMVPVGSFCVSVLAEGHEEIGARFARSGGPKFDGVDWTPSPSGDPILGDALAWFDCRFERSYPAGDHWFVLGRVRCMEVRPAASPLVFCRGGFHRLSIDPPDNPTGG